ncbi:x-ray repair cross complementing protein 2 [Diachasma alloeum]|uniref:X-ray repair cross complementing protein 2 n=2 Tax=Diachasma alloeum TaxID=454923 RepID=A0A4E0S4E8_9HYME|nr:x-ray repair cross complementing protein 2 [Diachasma alloeum]
METQTTAESGFGFLVRLASRPRFLNIETKLFPNGLLAKQTVEICGDTSTGKTLLLSQLMTKCLLPPVVEGLGIRILLLNTDHHFLVSKLFKLMSSILKNNWGKSDAEAEKIIRESLSNLTIINCYDYSQLMVSLHSLDLMLLKEEAVSLMMIDSISSFYWVHRERNGLCTLDHYVKNLLRIIQKHTFQANVPLIYTKSCETGWNVRERINCTTEPTPESINHRITLESNDRGFNCRVETSSEQENFHYRITDDGVHWL